MNEITPQDAPSTGADWWAQPGGAVYPPAPALTGPQQRYPMPHYPAPVPQPYAAPQPYTGAFPAYPSAAAASASSSTTIVVGGYHRRGVNHGLHAVLTLLTCGMWAPIWLILAVCDRG